MGARKPADGLKPGGAGTGQPLNAAHAPPCVSRGIFGGANKDDRQPLALLQVRTERVDVTLSSAINNVAWLNAPSPPF